MSILQEIILYSILAGSTVFFGGLISYIFEFNFKKGLLKEEISHTFMAFGAGIMLSAVSFVLVPEGVASLSITLSVVFLILGTVCFYILNEFIKKKKTTISQLLAMLLDFIPESISLGAMFVANHSIGLLLAVLISLQNLPESFNSYLELRKSKLAPKKILILLFILSFIGLGFALFGYYLLNDKDEITSSLMLFASGGILYLIFQDIAPAFRIKKSAIPVLGVNLGFIVGLICHLVAAS